MRRAALGLIIGGPHDAEIREATRIRDVLGWPARVAAFLDAP